jgi:hypothetical protein
MLTIFLIVVAVVIAGCWAHQFAHLMLVADDDFPGKYDKILWVAAFICAFFITPFAFAYWTSLRGEEPHQPRREIH